MPKAKTITSNNFSIGNILSKFRQNHNYDSTRLERGLRNRMETAKRRLSIAGPWFPGSAAMVKRRCSNEGCACHRSAEKMHSAMYVTWKEDGKTISIYIPKKHESEVKRRIQNYRLFKDSIKTLKLKMAMDMFKMIGIINVPALPGQAYEKIETV